MREITILSVSLLHLNDLCPSSHERGIKLVKVIVLGLFSYGHNSQFDVFFTYFINVTPILMKPGNIRMNQNHTSHSFIGAL